MNTDINEYSNRRKKFAIGRRADAIPYLISGATVLAISLLFTCLLNYPIEKLEFLSVVTWTIGAATISQCRYGFDYAYCETGFKAGTIAFLLGTIGITLCFPIFVARALIICIGVYGGYLVAMSFMHCHYEPFEAKTGWVYVFTSIISALQLFLIR